tara:strand:+ start:823 stop:1431 length:609 start_codon:yes stop_codon:yes gene_type:complete
VLFSVNYAKPTESGLWPLVVPVFKFIATLGAWEAAAWGIGELIDGAEEAEDATGNQAGEPVTAGYRAQTLSQMKGLLARGDAMLSGSSLTLYKQMIKEATEAINDPALTMADAAAFRTMLFRYTVKHGDCSAFPGELDWCEAYKKKWPGKVTILSKAEKPKNTTAPVLDAAVAAASVAPQASRVPVWVYFGAAGLAVWYFTK